MVWPCKQNASGKTPQTSFTCQGNGKRLDDLELDGPIALRISDRIALTEKRAMKKEEKRSCHQVSET